MTKFQGMLHLVLVLLLQSSAVFCNDQEDISYKIINPPHSGCEQEVKDGDNIQVNFIGTLKDGTEFVNTYADDLPYYFVVGSKKVPKGLSQGTLGMCPGEIREVNIPSHLGFGDEEKENIPRGSWLVYEIELIDFLEVKIDFFDTLDVDKNEQLNLEEVEQYFSLPEVSDVFGDVTSSESSLSFLTQTLMNLGDENGDDLISREEFYILQDFKNQQQKEKESMMEFREDL